MFKTIVELIENNKSAWVITGVISLAIIFNLKTIYEFWNAYSKRNLVILSDFLEKNYVTEQTKNILQEKINSILFNYATGIKAERILRQKILTLYESAGGSLTYKDLKRAKPFLIEDDNGELVIREFTIWDKIEFYFKSILSGFFMLIFTLLSVILIYLPVEPLTQLILLIYALLFFVLSVFLMSLTFPLSAARKISRLTSLRNAENNTKEVDQR